MNADRKKLIESLINTRFDGNQAAFGRAIGKSSGQVNQWLTGYRSIGNGTARHIEMELGLGIGWMDGKESSGNAAIQSIKEKEDVSDPIKFAAEYLATFDQDDAEIEISRIRAAANKARRTKEESNRGHKAHDSPSGKRCASS